MLSISVAVSLIANEANTFLSVPFQANFQHFMSCDMFSNLELLKALGPINVSEGKPKSIIPLPMIFSSCGLI